MLGQRPWGKRGSPEQARNLALGLDARTSPARFLIRDQDAKVSRFDTVLRSERIRVIRTPIQAPNADAHAERVIETTRAECLDWTLLWGRRHLDRTLRTYAEHDNRGRPPCPRPGPTERGDHRADPRQPARCSPAGTCSAG